MLTQLLNYFAQHPITFSVVIGSAFAAWLMVIGLVAYIIYVLVTSGNDEDFNPYI
jgi:hypothetical protein